MVNHLGTTSYTYDQRDRITRVEHPDGTYIAYTYDPAGNRTSVDIPSGITVYSFDDLNRLATVTDPDGGVTSYGYDAAGNRASVSLPNGTVISYTYDALNRLTLLENIAADGSIISSYAYTLGPAGNRLAVTEADGRYVEYSYDELYRLTREHIIEPSFEATTIGYTYDKVCNRLAKTVDDQTTFYSYDDNDRLLSEGVNTYEYDANGNTIAKVGDDGIVTYGYDAQDRLIRANTPTDSVEFSYNHENIRVAKRVGGVATRYLFDSNRPYQQVMEEYENDSLAVIYVHGDDLISQDRGEWSYYLYDGQVSTRQLVNGSGAVTDRYDYDAFGNLLTWDGSTLNPAFAL